MASQTGDTLKVTVKIDGASEVLKMFNGLSKETNDALRTEAGAIGTWLVTKVMQAAQRSPNPQARRLASTVTSTRDRVIALKAGGTKAVFEGSSHAGSRKASAALFATEFGLNPSKRGGPHGFQRHLGAHSYWFLSTVDANAPQVAKMWFAAVDKVMQSGAHDKNGASV